MQGIQHVQGGTAVVKNESKVVSNTVTVHSFQLIFNAVSEEAWPIDKISSWLGKISTQFVCTPFVRVCMIYLQMF